MTREEIQAELDALKSTKFDKNTDVELERFEPVLCSNCGRNIALSVMHTHLKDCQNQIEIRKKVIELHALGLDNNAIGKSLGVSGRTIGYHVIDLGLRPHGRQTTHKHTKGLVIKYAKENPNVSQNEICEIFKLHPSTVNGFLKGLKPTIREVKILKESQIESLYKQNPNSSAKDYMELTGYGENKIRTFFRDKGWILPNSLEDHKIKYQNNVSLVVELYHNGQQLSNNQIAKIVGIQNYDVAIILEEQNLVSWEILRYNQTRDRIRQAWFENPGQSIKFYMDKTGYSKPTVRKHLEDLKKK